MSNYTLTAAVLKFPVMNKTPSECHLLVSVSHTAASLDVWSWAARAPRVTRRGSRSVLRKTTHLLFLYSFYSILNDEPDGIFLCTEITKLYSVGGILL